MDKTINRQEVDFMPNVKIGPRHQITIPNEVYKKLKLGVGDFLELNLRSGNIILTPTKMIPRDQAWFWSKEWQEKIEEAEENVREEKLSGPFDNADDLINHLNKQK